MEGSRGRLLRETGDGYGQEYRYDGTETGDTRVVG